MFMRGLGREIHHCGESNLCPTQDSDWHLPSCKETLLALVHWIRQPPHRPLFIWAENCSCLFCSWADDYKLLSEMISVSGVKWGLRVTQSSEQTTSSNGENILYCAQHCCCFSMKRAISDLLRSLWCFHAWSRIKSIPCATHFYIIMRNNTTEWINLSC